MTIKRKMQISLGAFVFMVIMASALVAKQGKVKYPELKKEILAMRDEDQKFRQKYVELSQKGKEKTSKFEKVTQTLVAIDRKNTARMWEITKQYGWPTIEAVGKRASNAAWLVVQHADRDPVFQKYCLSLLESAMDKNQIDPPNYAFLYDRVQLAMGKKQKYATQSTRNDYTDKTFFQAIEDEANIQLRRDEMGINLHVEEYAKQSGFDYSIPSVEEAEKRAEEFKDSYEYNIRRAKEAFANKDYKHAADYYLQATYVDGHLTAKEYVETAKAISLANYEEKAYWGYSALMKAAMRGWEGVNELDKDPQFANLKKANPTNWPDLMRTVDELTK